MKRGFFCATLLISLPAAAFEASSHDKIVLKDGTVLVGNIVVNNPKEEFVWILQPGSRIKTPVKRKEIRMIIPRTTPRQAYERESAKVLPGQPERRMRLTRECISKRMYEEAKMELEKLLAEAPDYWRAMLLLSEVSLTLRLPDDAYRQALAACEIKPRNSEAQTQAGKAAAAAGLHEKAVAHLEIALEGTDLPEARVWRGISLAELGRLEEAERDLRGALENDPDDVYAHLGMGRLALAQCSLAEAAAALKQAATLVEKARLDRSKASPLRADIHRALGSVNYLSGQFSEAEEELRQALNEEPDSPAAFATLGLCGVLAGKGAEGIRYLRRANEKNEASGRAHIGLAYIFDVRGELVLALHEYDKAVSASPRDAYSWYMRGDANYRAAQNSTEAAEAQDHFRAAHASFARAAKLAPKFVDALRGAGAAALAVSDLEGSLKWFEKAATLAPKDPDVGAGLGLVCLARGELEEAENRLRRVVEGHPGNAQAMLGLGYIANAKTCALEAEQYFLTALADRSAAGYAVSALEKLCAARGLEFIHLDFTAPPLPGDWTVMARYTVDVVLKGEKLSFSGTQQKMRGGRTAFMRAVTSEGFSRIECKLEILTGGFEAGLYLEGPGAEIACGVDESGKLGYRYRDRAAVRPWMVLGGWPRMKPLRLVIERVEGTRGSFRLVAGGREVGPLEIQSLKRSPRYTLGLYTLADVGVQVEMLADDVVLITGQ